MSSAPKSERKHLVFIGRRNAGKSSLINEFTDQELSIVSDHAGTTTDPVSKAIELLPFGPVVVVDTAGVDDVGELGEKRISKTIKAISSADFVMFVFDATQEMTEVERDYLRYLDKIHAPFVCVLNKTELGINKKLKDELSDQDRFIFEVSCLEKKGIYELKEGVQKLIPNELETPLVSDLVKQGDIVVLVVPIDLGAPKGRLIAPQVHTIREALDEDAIVVMCKDKELRATLNALKEPPALVITDSQAIMRVAADVPPNVKLTTFSILMARFKGDLLNFVQGIGVIDSLENGDKVLVAEACTHHVQEDDIGRTKIPRWIRNYTKKELTIDVKSGRDFPEDVSTYKLIIHCGGCMLTKKAMQTRIKEANYVNIPIVNYGLIISYMHGAIPRALEPFPEAIEYLKGLQSST
ncbi:MAG: [FeFe] hydrogenase H-cluster maturation GTPase HydF [Bacteroidetes bacterium]|nr:[FeFe] hydrogenase H-cluster maturation GTPase HydF [Bacteroidota bacterium]